MPDTAFNPICPPIKHAPVANTVGISKKTETPAAAPIDRISGTASTKLMATTVMPRLSSNQHVMKPPTAPPPTNNPPAMTACASGTPAPTKTVGSQLVRK